ncbi:hypothetical protein [Ruegeria arenilitoris]|uniref:hypothetical protein n=1 Tax=Ruegeria arenilitoris TaxID=1173585 RepID=UPI00148083FE|nr:hypothetical protein [Ruegeria arenilitoris]
MKSETRQVSDFSLTLPSQVLVLKRAVEKDTKAADLVKRMALKHFIENYKDIDFNELRNSAFLDEIASWLSKLHFIGVADETPDGFEFEVVINSRRFKVSSTRTKVELTSANDLATGSINYVYEGSWPHANKATNALPEEFELGASDIAYLKV